MKRTLCAVITVVMCCLLCGCSKKPPSGDIYTLYLNGRAVYFPIRLESLGSDYSLVMGVVLKYKDTPVCAVAFDENSKEEDERKMPIRAFVASQFTTIEFNDFAVGGIVLGNTEQDVLRVFGEPTVKDDVLDKWTYSKEGKSEEDYYLGFSFDDYGRIIYIYFADN